MRKKKFFFLFLLCSSLSFVMVLCYLVFLILSFPPMSGHVLEPYRRIAHRTGDSNNNIRVESLPIHLFVVVKLSPNTIQAMYDGVFFFGSKEVLSLRWLCRLHLYNSNRSQACVCVYVKMPLEMDKIIRMGSTAAPMRIIRKNRTQTLSNYIYIRKCNMYLLFEWGQSNETQKVKNPQRKQWIVILLLCGSSAEFQ